MKVGRGFNFFWFPKPHVVIADHSSFTSWLHGPLIWSLNWLFCCRVKLQTARASPTSPSVSTIACLYLSSSSTGSSRVMVSFLDLIAPAGRRRTPEGRRMQFVLPTPRPHTERPNNHVWCHCWGIYTNIYIYMYTYICIYMYLLKYSNGKWLYA